MMENVMEVPQEIKIELPTDPAISVLGIYPKQLKSGSQNDTYLHSLADAVLSH